MALTFRNYVAQHSIQCVFLPRQTDTITGLPATGSIKTVIFLSETDRPVCVVALAGDRICQKRVAKHAGTARVRLADREHAESITGFPCGVIPPFGHRIVVATWIDELVLSVVGPLLCGAGDPNFVLSISVAELVRTARASTARLTKTLHSTEAIGAYPTTTNTSHRSSSSEGEDSDPSSSPNDFISKSEILRARSHGICADDSPPDGAEPAADAADCAAADERGSLCRPAAPLPPALIATIALPIPNSALVAALAPFRWRWTGRAEADGGVDLQIIQISNLY
jgi:prolyl-tRNA editing enzyme YbaK/EbsC (Cys-tRNA(Pro) deacylase)